MGWVSFDDEDQFVRDEEAAKEIGGSIYPMGG